MTAFGPVVFTNIQNGQVVWFIWSNVDDNNFEIYNHMISTFEFGSKSPKSLIEAYGQGFYPQSLAEVNAKGVNVEQISDVGVLDTELDEGDFGILGTDPPGYRLPFSGQYVITCGPQCCSSHQSLPEAIDYGLPNETDVKSTYSGNVSFFGWKNDTYGNYLSIDHSSSRRSHYAHLAWFWVYSLGEPVSTGELVASSGDTGVGNAHLHFEVRTRPDPGTGLWIRTLPTTSWISGDPNNPCWGSDTDYDGTANGP